MTVKPGYIPEIDGLRAIAVATVLLYHLSASILPGGFVGVDIFFVLSGFLITRQLATAIARDRFSILDFYQRRIGRIAPAALTRTAGCACATEPVVSSTTISATCRTEDRC